MQRILLMLACACACAVGARAQEPTPLAPTDKAPVVIDGRVLFEVGEAGTWSPQQRAREINRVLSAAVAAPQPVGLVMAEHDGFPTIRMDEWHLLTVMDSDVQPGMDPGEQAQRWLQTVEAALLEARSERSAEYLAPAALRTLVALLLAAVVHWLLRRLSRRLSVRLARHGTGAPAAAGEWGGWQLAVQLACMALQVLTWGAVLRYAVDEFPASRQLDYAAAVVVGGGLNAALFMMNEHSYSALDVLWLIAAVVGLWVVVSLLVGIVSGRLQRATGAPRGALQPVATVVRYVLIFLGIIVILQVAGLNLSSLAIFASVLGVGIGFGLQSIANNFVSGLVLSFERPIKPGDFVSLADLHGVVQRIGARSTIVRTLDRVSIIVPNARLLEHEVVNWSWGDELVRVHLPVGVAYGSDVQQVRAALLEVARSHPAVLTDPRPDVFLLGFGDNALNFELLVWTKNPPGQQALKSELYYAIEASLGAAGIAIPFPQRTLHIAPGDVDSVLDRVQQKRAAPEVALYDPSGALTAVRRTAAPVPRPLLVADPSAAPAPLRTGDVGGLIAEMRGANGLAIHDRRHLLSTYPKCFVGTEAVDWMIRARDLTRPEAVNLGQTLVDRGIIHHVLDEHPFRDGHYFYRFYADESPPAS
jgi:small-conductance mechanosensitive channel